MRFEATLWRSFAFGSAVTSLLLLPVWRDIFFARGVFFDSAFISNHHQIDASFQLDYLAGILVMVALSLVLGAAIAAAARKSPRHAQILVTGMTMASIDSGIPCAMKSSIASTSPMVRAASVPLCERLR